MGPALIPDKSICQGLNSKLVNRLHSLFFPVFTTVLFRECAGNLGKHSDIEASITEFKKTAKVIRAGHGRFLPDVHTLLDLESTGTAFALDGRPIVIPASVNDDGNSLLIEEEEERTFIRRWTQEELIDGEREFWGSLRHDARSYPLEREFIELKKHLNQVDTGEEAVDYVNDILSDCEKTYTTIDRILAVSTKSPRSILERIHSNQGDKSLSKYPYHEHVLRIILLFYVLLASKLIGTRSTNRIDLEYLLYLPFCQVFASGDKMHREIFDALKIKNCVYLERDELRNDLIEIDKYFDSFETKDLKYYKKTFGSYPPPIPDSPICSIWERFVGERRILKNKIHQPDMKVIYKDYMSHFKSDADQS